MTLDEAKELKTNMHIVFDSPQGKEIMLYMEKIGSWIPNVFESGETNDIIARDANRRLIGTLKTILKCSVSEIVALTKEE